MEKQFNYVTRLDVKFEHLQRMDVNQIWFNQTLTNVNDSVVRLGIVEGEYYWHKHDNDDRAPMKTVMLMVKTSAIQPTGD